MENETSEINLPVWGVITSKGAINKLTYSQAEQKLLHIEDSSAVIVSSDACEREIAAIEAKKKTSFQ